MKLKPAAWLDTAGEKCVLREEDKKKLQIYQTGNKCHAVGDSKLNVNHAPEKQSKERTSQQTQKI